MRILTDYYRAEQLTVAKSRFDVTASTGDYLLFENLLINKRIFNIGGLSFNYVKRPDNWRGKASDMAITKGNHNITSVKRSNIESNYAYGDINGSNDGCIIIFNSDHKERGVNTIEIFIARGCKNDTGGLLNLFCDRELESNVETLRKEAVKRQLQKM
jgi:hypothetical protein